MKAPNPNQWVTREFSLSMYFTFEKISFIYFYFWLHSVFVAVHGFSLEAESGDYSLVAVYGLMVASLAAEHRL